MASISNIYINQKEKVKVKVKIILSNFETFTLSIKHLNEIEDNKIKLYFKEIRN